jgi:FtsH-binding integral membrane protein
MNKSMEDNSSITGQIRPGAVARDVAIIWVLTLIGGFIVGISTPLGTTRFMIGIAVSNTILTTIAFIIIGCLVGENRWKHMTIVTVATWLVSAFNIFLGVGPTQWFFSIIAMFLFMGIGGGISYLFRK